MKLAIAVLLVLAVAALAGAQSEYQSLSPGDRIAVTGTLSPERDRVLATSIDPSN